MTTTTDKMTNRVVALMERARHSSTLETEAVACREKAADLVKKYQLPSSLLTDPTAIRSSAARGPATPHVEKTYLCRFGCGVFISHTADEMGKCAERRRNETGRDSAYERAGDRMSYSFGDFFNAGSGYRGGGHHERASYRRRTYTYTPPRDEPRTGSESATGGAYMRDEPKPKRRQTSHANCLHEPTKAARARCRKMGGPMH